MFENLSERLERSFKLLKGQGKITEINVAETLKDVRRALLDADVNYSVAKQFTDTVKAKALGQNVITAVKPSELLQGGCGIERDGYRYHRVQTFFSARHHECWSIQGDERGRTDEGGGEEDA